MTNDQWRAPNESPAAYEERVAHGGFRGARRTYRFLIIFPMGQRHELIVHEWVEFRQNLDQLVLKYGQPPDLIYQVHT